MRTKTLLCAAVLAAGVASTMAQSNVYSLNVVGYYNVVVPAFPGRVMLGNQLAVTAGGINDTLSNTIPVAPDFAQFFKYNGGFSSATYDAGALAWDSNPTLKPGEGGFFTSPVATTLTFVGEVLQGSLTNTLPLNQRVLRASIVPQAGGVTSDLKLPVQGLDELYQYHGGYAAFGGDSDFVWAPPGEPTNKVGEAFFYVKRNGFGDPLIDKWVRNFTVQ